MAPPVLERPPGPHVRWAPGGAAVR